MQKLVSSVSTLESFLESFVFSDNNAGFVWTKGQNGEKDSFLNENVLVWGGQGLTCSDAP